MFLCYLLASYSHRYEFSIYTNKLSNWILIVNYLVYPIVLLFNSNIENNNEITLIFTLWVYYIILQEAIYTQRPHQLRVSLINVQYWCERHMNKNIQYILIMKYVLAWYHHHISLELTSPINPWSKLHMVLFECRHLYTLYANCYF